MPPSPPGRDRIVIGTSAGGVQALVDLAKGLPPDLAAAIFVVIHLSPHHRTAIHEIISRAGPLPATLATDGDAIVPGRIYVAPPDRHLSLEADHMCVDRGPHDNGHRPSVDVLFRSAARVFGTRVIGVVLTGSLDCGASGLVAVKRAGGVAIVQDPAEAPWPDMPRNALAATPVDHVTRIGDLADLLVRLTHEPAGPSPAPEVVEAPEPTTIACPTCHGTLWEAREGRTMGFACRIGHKFSFETLVAHHSAHLESALWAAVRALEESAALSRRLTVRYRHGVMDSLVARYEAKTLEDEDAAIRIRGIVTALRAPMLGQSPIAPPIDEHAGEGDPT